MKHPFPQSLTPWRPGAVFTITPIDIVRIDRRYASAIDKVGLLRYWQRECEVAADNAIATMIREACA